jgi:hypothetical protein
MSHADHRRAAQRGALMLMALVSTIAPAAAGGLDGTWAGLTAKRETAQIIVVGDQIVGFYWNGDYTDATHAKAHGDAIAFDFPRGAAELKRTAAGAALTIRENGAVTHIDLKKD